MGNILLTSLESVTTFPTVKYVFSALLLLTFLLTVGHLYIFRGLTGLYLGLPLWIWLQLGTVLGLIGVTWIAVTILVKANSGTV